MRKRKRKPATLYGLAKHPDPNCVYSMGDFDEQVLHQVGNFWYEDYWRNDPTYFSHKEKQKIKQTVQ